FVIPRVVGRLDVQRTKFDSALWERRHPCLRVAGILAGPSITAARINNLRYPLIDRFLKLSRRKRVIDQSPFFRALAFQTFSQSREHIRAVATNFALINQ